MRAIVTYHSVDGSRSPISIAPDAFRAHVAGWRRGRARVLALADLLEEETPGDAVALTFDDAFASFATLAWPLLRDAGLPATLFVVTGHAGETNLWGGVRDARIPELPLCDWHALGRLAEEGVELGAHSRTHPRLTQVSAGELEDELAGAAAEIERRTGRRPTAFAYPYGDHDAPVRAAAARHYALAVTTEMRVLRRGEDPHRLPRLDACYLNGPAAPARLGAPAARAWLAARAAARAARGRLGGG